VDVKPPGGKLRIRRRAMPRGAMASVGSAAVAVLLALGAAPFAASANAVPWTGASSSSAITSQAWRWQNPLPQGNPVQGIAFPTATGGWFVADAGTVMHSADGGITWKSQRAGTSAALNAVAFVGPRTGWVVGASGVIRRTTDGGAHWLRQRSGTNLALYAVAFADSRHGWVVGDRGLILRTVNGGKTWTKRQVGNRSDPLRSVACAGLRRAWAAGDSNLMVRTVDGGVTWKTVRTGLYWENDLCDVTFTSATAGWLLANYSNTEEPAGTLLRTTDGGRRWRRQTWAGLGSSVSRFQEAAFGAGGSFGVVTGARLDPDTLDETPVVLRSRDGGETWTDVSGSIDATPAALAVTPADRAVVATEAGPLRCSDDQCTTWSTVGSAAGSGAQLMAVDFVDGQHGWAVGDHGQIVVTADGSTWRDQASGTTKGLRDVAFTDDQRGWAVGEDVVLRTQDGGTNWTAHDVGAQATWECAVFADPQLGWLAGNSWSAGGQRWVPVVLRTEDGGASWSPGALPASRGVVKALCFLDADRGWAVGQAVWRTRDGGRTWVRLPWTGGTAPELRDVVFRSPTVGFAVGEHCAIWRTTDGGASWKLLRAASSRSWEWFGDLSGIGFASGQSGWAVGSGGLILQTIDGGATWVRRASGTAEELTAVDMVDDQHVWAVGGHACIVGTASVGAAASGH
jgi:photosystem II stability/assembly factor-like uncharacterized protein